MQNELEKEVIRFIKMVDFVCASDYLNASKH